MNKLSKKIEKLEKTSTDIRRYSKASKDFDRLVESGVAKKREAVEFGKSRERIYGKW